MDCFARNDIYFHRALYQLQNGTEPLNIKFLYDIMLKKRRYSMKTSLLKTYKKEIIFFYVLSAVSLAAATFFDLQIDIFLNNTKSIIATWFEKTGEMPASVLITIAVAFIVKCCDKKWIKYVGSAVTLGAGGYFGSWFGGRLFTEDDFQTVFSIIFGVGFAAVTLFVMHFIVIPENAKKPLLVISVLGLAVLGAESGIVGLMKGLWGRERFRNLDGNYSQFTPWYVINGFNGRHSFPSGHTGSAGMSYLLMLLPFVSEKCRKYKTALFAGGFFYTSLVAATRLVMGAHYLSDVTVGGVVSFSLTLAAIAVYEKLQKGSFLK